MNNIKEHRFRCSFHIYSVYQIELKRGKVLDASAANELTLEVNDVGGVSAEDAGRVILFKNDLIVIYEYFKRCAFIFKLHAFAGLFWQYYSSKLVYRSYDSR